jgi:hypothetical protein
MEKAFVTEVNKKVYIYDTKIPRGEFGFVYRIYPPLWHPNVFFIGNYMVEKDIEIAKCILSNYEIDFSHIYNLDAAIMYKQNKEEYIERNKKIDGILSDKERTCLVCFEEECTVVFTCYNMHWVCLICFDKLHTCPLCDTKIFCGFK